MGVLADAMSRVEKFITEEQLALAERSGDSFMDSLCCRVERIIAPRQREFSDGVVFTIVAHHLTKPECTDLGGKLRLNFYDGWASAASFVDPDNVLILRGWCMMPSFPSLKTENSDAAAATEPSGQRCVLVTEDIKDASLRVIQPGEAGDRMEVTVSATHFDVPCVRVLPPSTQGMHCTTNLPLPSM